MYFEALKTSQKRCFSIQWRVLKSQSSKFSTKLPLAATVDKSPELGMDFHTESSVPSNSLQVMESFKDNDFFVFCREMNWQCFKHRQNVVSLCSSQDHVVYQLTFFSPRRVCVTTVDPGDYYSSIILKYLFSRKTYSTVVISTKVDEMQFWHYLGRSSGIIWHNLGRRKEGRDSGPKAWPKWHICSSWENIIPQYSEQADIPPLCS